MAYLPAYLANIYGYVSREARMYGGGVTYCMPDGTPQHAKIHHTTSQDGYGFRRRSKQYIALKRLYKMNIKCHYKTIIVG